MLMILMVTMMMMMMISMWIRIMMMVHVVLRLFFSVQECASNVTAEDLAVWRVYPNLDKIKPVSLNIAVKVAEFLYDKGLASNVCPAFTLHFFASLI